MYKTLTFATCLLLLASCTNHEASKDTDFYNSAYGIKFRAEVRKSHAKNCKKVAHENCTIFVDRNLTEIKFKQIPI